MGLRSLFTGSGSARSALLLVAVGEAIVVENLLLAQLLAADDMHSLFLFGLQLPHLLSMLLAFTIVCHYRSALSIVRLLFGVYVFAFACDVVGIVAHGIFSYKATDAREIRNEAAYAGALFVLCAIDALGVHFAKLLRDCLQQEIEYMSALADRPQ